MNIESLAYANRFEGITGSAIREIFKLLRRPGMISFAGGNPASSALRDDWVLQLAQEVLEKDGKAILQYGATEGYPAFVESLCAYVNDHLSIPALPSNILPVTGSTQAMDLLCKSLINPGDTILVEDPTFLGNMQCMRLYQADLIPTPGDEGGVILSELEKNVVKHKPKMLYIIPTFQNPLGRTLALERRKPIAQMAEKYGFIVAEDDPYRDLRYEGKALPTIKSFDEAGFTAFLGSFSKIISPGMRVGFLVAHETLIRKCTVAKQSSDLHTANLTQAIVDLFLRKNFLPGHVQSVCSDYRLQMNAMIEELETFPSGTKYVKPEGGLFIFVTLPDKINASNLLSLCVKRGVAFVPGTHFFAKGGHDNTLRLNFSNSTVDTIHKGMAILKQAIIEMLEEA